MNDNEKSKTKVENEVSNNINENIEDKKNYKYCNCGQKLEDNWEYCPKCKAQISPTKGSFIIIIYFLLIISTCFFNYNCGIWIALLIIIIGKIKYPNNAIIKILFWVSIICLLFIVYIIIMVLNACNGLY